MNNRNIGNTVAGSEALRVQRLIGLARAARARALAPLARRVGARLDLWRAIRRTLREVERVGDDELRDMGLSRADLRRAMVEQVRRDQSMPHTSH